MSANRRIKPTRTTPFHIDYSWWERDEKDLRVYLISHLPPEQQSFFKSQDNEQQMDWVDPETGEVRRVDALQMALQEVAQSEDFVRENTSLIDQVFRVFLANGNQPLSPEELGEITGRSPDTILRTISGTRIYRGIRPALS